MSDRIPAISPVFDLSLLPPVDLQFLVVSDTHYVLPDNAQAEEWTAVDEFTARTERALRMAATLPHDFAVHLGDLSHEYPETGRAQTARIAARDQFEACGLRFYHAAGNMDIGDKPDPTSPASWVSPSTLDEWRQAFGPSWQSFEIGELHGIVLNTQIMNGPLMEATEQARWLEHDLAQHSDKRLLLFLHMPIYVVEPGEQGLGFYNSLDEPARSWLLGLIEQHNIEFVFAGHTHFVGLNRWRNGRLYIAPSTATSRAGLAEAFTVQPPDRGRGDIHKLGFYFVRLDYRGASVHLIRTGGDTPALRSDDPRALLVTRISRELPHGRLGIMASHPLGHRTPGPVIWPSIVRQPVRDDWRLLACLELGARVIRVPSSDLDDPNESERIAVLRDEGVAISAFWLWSERIDIGSKVLEKRASIDEAEIVLPGQALPTRQQLDEMASIRAAGVSITLSPVLLDATQEGQYHRRSRVGYLLEELGSINTFLVDHDEAVDRLACRLTPGKSPWEFARAACSVTGPAIAALDFYLDLNDEDDQVNSKVIAEAISAVATVPHARLIVGPLVDLDRSMDASFGLLDRLSNPRPAFQVARCLNSLLFSSGEPVDLVAIENRPSARQIDMLQGSQKMSLILTQDVNAPLAMDLLAGSVEGRNTMIYDLAAGTSTPFDNAVGARAEMVRATRPILLVGR